MKDVWPGSRDTCHGRHLHTSEGKAEAREGVGELSSGC